MAWDVYGNGSPVPLNWTKLGVPGISRGGVGGARNDVYAFVDPATGQLKTDGSLPTDLNYIRFLIYEPGKQGNPTHTYLDEPFTIRWQGSPADVQVPGAKSGSVSVNLGTKTATFLGSGDTMEVWLYFSSGAGSYADPPRNVEVYQTRYETERTAGWRVNPWVIDKLKNAKIARFMDPLQVNYSELTDYEQLTPANYLNWGGNIAFGDPVQGLPLEIICEIADRSGCDVWVNISRYASNTCIARMAAYMRDHCRTKVHWEYSNEPWNFAASDYATNDFFLPLPTYSVGPYQDGTRVDGAARRACQAFEIIRNAYGPSNRGKWDSHINTWTEFSGGDESALIAKCVMNFCGEANPPYHISDLVGHIATSCYWGRFGLPAYWDVTAITRGTDTTITTTAFVDQTTGNWISYQLAVGDPVRLQIPDGQGCQSLRGVSHAVKSVTAHSFTIEADTTGDTDMTSYAGVLWARGEMSDLYEQGGQALNDGLYSAVMNGTMPSSRPGGVWDATTVLVTLETQHKQYLFHRSVCDDMGITVSQYEGGTHMGSAMMQNGGEDLDVPVLHMHLDFAASAQAAKIHHQNLAWSREAGVEAPAQYMFNGERNRFGMWGCHQYLPQVGALNGDDSVLAKAFDAFYAAQIDADPFPSFAFGTFSTLGGSYVFGGYRVGGRVWATGTAYRGWPWPTITYKWQRSSDGSTGWTDISGATSRHYDPVSADAAKYLRRLTYQGGTLFSTSAASPAIAA